jgi:FG-GAP-like repeat
MTIKTCIMKKLLPLLALCLAGLAAGLQPARSDEKTGLHFDVQEIETGLTVGYGVLLVDVNGDGKPDIVVADSRRVIWFENPTWKRHTIIQGLTKPDNVCLAAYDIDGDGQIDFALGADWHGTDTKALGTLQWLKRGRDIDEPWTLHPIGAEPTLHRIRFADIDGDGKPELIAVPLMGRHSTQRNNWMDDPVRILAYKIPADPVRGPWQPTVLNQSLHVTHNFFPLPSLSGKGMDLLVASYEGVNLLTHDVSGRWQRRLIGEGNQENPRRSRGSSEIKEGKLRNGGRFLATIEPWHGNQVVVYTPPRAGDEGLWQRQVIDERLAWGHAVWCADLDGDGDDELIIGVRDTKSDEPGARRGVRIYKAIDSTPTAWSRQIVEDGGVAVEDLAAADLDGDGKTDIVAVGRQTHNVRIYWNRR